jgi:hypothetical protein
LGCSYLTALSTDEAKAKGIETTQRGRPGMYYAPGTGLFVVRPPQLPAGGGSLGGANAAAPAPSPTPSPATR